MHMPAYIYSLHSFFSLYPLIVPPVVLLWIWYFLIPPLLSRIRFILQLYFSCFVKSRLDCSCYRPVLLLSFSLPTAFTPSFSLILSFSPLFILPCQSNTHFSVFIFRFSLRSSSLFFSLFLYCTSSPWLILHYHFLVSFLHFVFPHGLHCAFLTPSISSIHTVRLARRDGFSSPACRTAIRHQLGT